MKFATLNVIVRELAKDIVPRALDLDFHLASGFDGWQITLHDWKRPRWGRQCT